MIAPRPASDLESLLAEAQNNPAHWQRLIETRLVHKILGIGTIKGIENRLETVFIQIHFYNDPDRLPSRNFISTALIDSRYFLEVQLLEHEYDKQASTIKISSFSEEYQKSIEKSLRRFIRNGDDVVCIGYYAYEYGHCEMCSHQPIKWHYLLENLQTHRYMLVGSECIQNYQIILSEWGYKPEYVVFPVCLKSYTRWILEKNPQAVIFNDATVMRFKTNCKDIMQQMERDNRLKHYKYVKQITVNGFEELISVKSSEQATTNSSQVSKLQSIDDCNCPF